MIEFVITYGDGSRELVRLADSRTDDGKAINRNVGRALQNRDPRREFASIEFSMIRSADEAKRLGLEEGVTPA